MQGIRLNGRKRIVIESLFILLALVLITVDQWTKLYFSTNFNLGEKKVIINNFFYFSYAINRGAAWSFLSNVSWGQLFFKILTPIALVVFILFYIYSVKKNYKWLKVSLVFIISGTIGNFIDRLLIDGVVDFIGFIFGEYHFPVFNLADSFLTIGIIMLIVYFLFIDKYAVFKRNNAKKDNSSK